MLFIHSSKFSDIFRMLVFSCLERAGFSTTRCYDNLQGCNRNTVYISDDHNVRQRNTT